MFKKSLAWLLTLMMVVSMLPMSVFATDGASGGDALITTEEALQAAVNAGGTVTLAADIGLKNTLNIPAEKTVTLDLGGYTLTGPMMGNCIDVNGNLTLTNGRVSSSAFVGNTVKVNNGGVLTVGTGAVVTSKSYAPVAVAGKVIVDGGTVQITDNSNTNDAISLWDGGEAVVKSGTVSAAKLSDAIAASDVNKVIKVVIEGGDINGNVDFTAGAGSEVAITGGTFDEDVSAYVPDGYAYDAETGTVAQAAPATPAVKIGDRGFATLAEALEAAKAMSGEVTVEIYDKVEYTDATPDLTGAYNTINFVGKTEDAEISITRNGSGGYISSNANVTFTDLILSKPEGSYAGDAGYMNLYFTVYRAGTVIYTNCTFPNGACAQGGAATYNNCTFANQTSGLYSLFVYGKSTNVIVNGGKFSGVRGVKMYTESKTVADAGALSLNGVTFTDSVTQKPAIVLTYGASVTLSGNNYSSTGVFELDLDGAPNGTTVTSDVPPTCKNDNGACGVLVDGKIYTTVAQAAAVATKDSTVTLLHNSAESVELPEGVTLNKNGFEAPNVTVKAPAKNIEVTDAQGNVTYLENFWGFSASNVTIKLLADVGDYNLNLQKATGVVLDLNGHTFDRSDGNDSAISLMTGSELTLKDSSAEKTGKVCAKNYAVWIQNGTFVLESGTIETASTTKAAIEANVADVTIAGGKIISAGTAILIGENFMESRGASTVTLQGGEIEAGGVGILGGKYAQAATVLNVTGGAITSGGDSIAMTTGTAAVTGGTFSKDVSDYCADGFECKVNDNGTYGVGEEAPAVTYVANIGTQGYATLQAAIDAVKNGETITLVDDITEKLVNIEKAAGVAFTIDGNYKNFTGEFEIGIGENIVINNVNFVASAEISPDYFIDSMDQNSNCVLTIQGCTFTDTDYSTTAIGTHQPTKVVIDGCVTNGVASLLQNQGGYNITVKNTTVEGKRGISLGTVVGATVENVKIKAADDKYGIRLNGEIANNTITIKDCEITAFIPVVVRKAQVENYTVVFNGTNIMTPKNTDGLWCAIGATEYETNGTMPTAPTGKVTVTLNDTGLDKAGVYGAYKAPATSTLTNCYTSQTGYWGECRGNASESFVFKFYNGETYMGSTSLNNVGGIIDGDVNVSFNILLDAASNRDEYWTMEWTVQPTLTMQPTRVEHWVDGVKAAEAAVEPNWSDNIFPVVAVVADADGKILSYVNNHSSATLANAFANGGNIVLLRDVALNAPVTVPANVVVTLDLNGKTISGTDTATGSFGLINIQPGAKLTINDTAGGGKITLAATNNRGWNAYSSVISNQRGTLIVNGGTLEHLGGTDMAYAIDNLTNGKGTYAETVINGGTIKSPYRAIRQFLNGTEAQNILTINGGTVEGANKAVWMQDPNVHANSGKITIGAAAVIKGDVYLDVTEGSTEWPVEVSIAAAALADGKTVITENIPAGYVVKSANGVWGVVKQNFAGTGTEADPYIINNVDDLIFFRNSVNAGETYDNQYFKLTADIDLAAVASAAYSTRTVTPNWTPIGTKDNPFKGTFDGDGKTISNMIVVGEVNQGFFGYADNATIKNLNLKNVYVYGTDCVGAVAGQVYSVSLIDNCHVSGTIQIEGQTNVGGIVGKYYTKVTNCSVIGDGVGTSYVKGTYVASDLEGDNVGGIMGHCGENNNLSGNTVKNITISGTRKVGGIVGIADQNTDVKNCVVENVVIKTTATADYANSKKTSMSIGGLIGQYQAAEADKTYDGTVTANAVTGVTFTIPEGVTCEAGVIVGGARGGSTGMLAPATDVTASGNTVSDVTGATNKYLMTVVAKIGEQGYATLAEAIAAAQPGETITLIESVTQTDGVIITDKNLTIDLNGNTFTVTEGASTNNRNFKINGSSVVTIKNGTMVAAGDYSSGAYGTLRTEGTAKVTLTDLKLYNYRGNGLNIKALTGTEVKISNTEIYSQYGGGVESAGGTIELTDVKVEQKGMYTAPYNSMAISVNGGGKVTVNSGTYSTECITAEEANNQGTSHGPWVVGVLNSGGTLVIKGGTFSNDNFGDNALATAARGAVLADTGAIISIEGGTFNALKGIIDIQNNLGDASKNPSGTISGGTFSADPTNNYVKIADNYAALPALNGNYVVGEKPTATVKNLGMTTVAAGGYMVYGNGDNSADMPLSFVMQFLADQGAEDMTTSPYADWYGDFVITFTGIKNGSFTADGCYLAGHYGSFGWVKVPVDGMVIENGARYPVMLGVGLGQKYDYICSSVEDFKCALYLTPEILAANPNIKVNLELAVVDNSQGSDAAASALVNNKNVYSVTDYTYNAEDFVVKTYVAQIGTTKYETLAAALAAAQDGETIELLADAIISEGTIRLPAAMKNVTIKGAEGAVIKDTTITAADGNSLNYEGLTFEGITFENSRISITGWRTNGATVKDMTVTGCTFKKLNDTTNSAPVHINMDADEAIINFTFTNNKIDGATGGSKSGLYLQATGKVLVTGNTINNVSFRPYVIQITTDDGIADELIVTGNTFSGSAAGRAQGLGNNAEGTDTVKLVVSENIFKDITSAQQICYWNFNSETTTADLSKNYYDIDIMANPNKIYYNSAAADVADLIEMGVFPYYADEAMTTLVEAPAIMVTYPDGKVEYYDDMLEAVPYTTNCPRLEGAVVTLLKDIEAPGIRMMENDMVLDLNGHTYTITAGTGSQGTNTSGFQIRPEVTTTATIKNGTINVAAGAPVVWMFNVYATNFVVENVTVDCANMAYSYGEQVYVHVSHDGDNTKFTGTTKFINFNAGVAGKAINVGGTMTIGEDVVVGGAIELDAGATLTAPANLDVTAPEGYKVVYENGVYSAEEVNYVAQVGDVKYETFLAALDAAIANNAAEIKVLDNTREVLTDDYDIVINADLTITADAPVTVEFYNNGTQYDFCVGSNNNNTLTVGENVTFSLVDRVIWLGFYGNNVDVVVNGTLSAYQIWHGADTTVNATGTLKSTGEALVMRRGATLTVNEGKVEANYFNILAGNIEATKATITCGAFWIANTGSYANEGNVNIKIADSTLTSSGNFKSSTTHNDGVNVEVSNSTVKFSDFDGYGASEIDADTTLTLKDGTNLTFKTANNNGTINVAGAVTMNGAVTNNGTITLTDAAATLTANEGLTVKSGVTDYNVEYADGKYSLEKKAVEQVTFTLNGLNLRLQDLIRLGFYFNVNTNVSLDEVGALLWTADEYAEETDFTINSTLAYKTLADRNGAGYSVETEGIYAQKLDTVYYIIPYAKTASGTYVYGEVKSSSAIVYANIVYNGGNFYSDELKSIVIDLLNYATAARTYFCYTEDLEIPTTPFNSILSEADRQVKWSEDLKAAYPSVAETTGTYNPSIYGLNTNLLEAIKLNFIFTGSISGGVGYWNETEYSALDSHNASNMAHQATISMQPGYTTSSVENLYSFHIYSNFYAMAYDSDGNCSRTYGASVASYLTTVIETTGNSTAEDVAMVNLAKALQVYGHNAMSNPEVNKGGN